MVNFGYGPASKYWQESKKEELAEELRKLLLDMKLTRNTEIEHGQMLHEYPEPYIEVDSLYAGVRIRKITHLTEEQQDKLVEHAERIYMKIMTE